MSDEAAQTHDGDGLRRDGHGIDRLPIKLSVNGTPYDDGLVAVRADDLDALEQLLDDARNIVATCSEAGIHWDDPADRADFFAEATEVWGRLLNVLRGDDG